MLYVFLGVIGALAGAFWLRGDGAFLAGGLVGVLAAAVISLKNQVGRLMRRMSDLEARQTAARTPADPAPQQPRPEKETAETFSVSPEIKATPFPARRPAPEEDLYMESVPDTPTPKSDVQATPDSPAPDEKPPFETQQDPSPPPAAHDQTGFESFIRSLISGGNLMVRVGVVILLFGFAFLIKYAAARNMVPLEVRLAAAFAAGIGLLALGWRLRSKRFGYAMALQGGGLGIMYLTLFASARLFHMVPLPLTFGVMVALVAFSGMLAVLQNAASMAVLGAAGGFLAPVLLSTGSGNHVLLFSYYALLNAGIFGIAWFKAWRWLNLLGFFFTFGIGSAWGLQYYRSSHFTTTEPFLVISFAFYLTISVLFAFKLPPKLKGYVDGTLVFGLPVVVFGLQVPLVQRFEYGLAFSALVMGMVYITLATSLWRRRTKEMAPLVEAFLALGVVFSSLAIPLALSGLWTAVAWSLEGAGLVWVGVRQRRLTARLFGLLLQFGAGFLFLADGRYGGGMMILNSRFLGGMMIAVAAMVSAFFLDRYRSVLRALEQFPSALIMAWGLVWWFGAGVVEIEHHWPDRYQLECLAAFVVTSCGIMGWLCHRLDWKGLRWPAVGLLPFMVFLYIVTAHYSNDYRRMHPFQDWWLAIWPLALAVHFLLLWKLESKWPKKLLVPWHVTGGLLIIFLLSREAAWGIDRLMLGSPAHPGRLTATAYETLMRRRLGLAGIQKFIAWGMVPAAGAWVLKGLFRKTGIRPEVAYNGWLPFLIMLGLTGWTFFSPSFNGAFVSLPYLPLLNPLDVVQAFVLLTILYWCRSQRQEPTPPAGKLDAAMLWGAPVFGVFLWLTAIVARTVHHWGHVPYSVEALGDSAVFQASLSVLWGALALGTMVTAHRLKQRAIWFTGAGLLAVVLVKLFIVDLSGTGTVSRIVSFLAVGALMLIIGFFTPLPPAADKGATS